MTSATLTFDVHVMILEWGYRSTQCYRFEYYRKTLVDACLVCKAWTPVAQSLLFRRLCTSVRGIIGDSAPMLLQAITDKPVLGTYVRSPIIHHRDVPDTIISLLALCPQLVKLTFEFPYASVTSAQLAQIEKMNLGIQVLEIGGPLLVKLAKIWAPTLRFVHILDRDDGGPMRPPAPPSSPMSLQGVKVTYPHTLSVLAPWLFQSDTRFHPVFYPQIGPSFLLCEASLRNLDSWVGGITSLTCYTVPPASTLKLLTGLEELIIHCLPRSSFKLPPTVRHFGIHLALWYESSITWDVLITSVIPHPFLQLVTVTRLEDEKLASLEHACRDNAVDFVVHRDLLAFPRSQYVDWLRKSS
ncbi:hypothetical protein BV25DRAFT_1919321 [Artomyces pyxidatus]|uniref:Uncharacterized protein n=1 Tax=Artomyces pyxidatus TaxID=48021 RepID=A0ACB8SPL3_9AGAM|nr:hypothetical protein BV25DRAFT_1919321 [Artomyces pyxidatus]